MADHPPWGRHPPWVLEPVVSLWFSWFWTPLKTFNRWHKNYMNCSILCYWTRSFHPKRSTKRKNRRSETNYRFHIGLFGQNPLFSRPLFLTQIGHQTPTNSFQRTIFARNDRAGWIDLVKMHQSSISWLNLSMGQPWTSVSWSTTTWSKTDPPTDTAQRPRDQPTPKLTTGCLGRMSLVIGYVHT